jgi:hypothetical protein
MKIYAAFLVGIGAFFGIIGTIYWFTSYEDGGFAMLVGSALLGLLPGSYYLWWSYKMKPQADDDERASVEEGAGTIDSFPGSSIWPFVLGMGALFAVLTFVFGLWMAPIAVALILSAAIGGVVESRHGGEVSRSSVSSGTGPTA